MEKAAGNGESESDYESGVDEAIGVDLADQIVVDQSGEWETPEKDGPYDRREQPGEWRDHHKVPPSKMSRVTPMGSNAPTQAPSQAKK